MDTTKTAAEIFGDQFSALELLFGFEAPGTTPGERLSGLGTVSKGNPELVKKLQSFFENPLHFATKFSSTENTFELATKTLFAAAARGVLHDYGAIGAPKKQHWMPLAYLNPFGMSVGAGKSNRAVLIPGVSFADGFTMNFETRDSNFIHEKVNSAGFYEDSAEFFFHLIEGLYAQGRTRTESSIDHSLVALFFFVQSVRNPRYGQRFVHSKLSDIIDAILANMDAVGAGMQTQFVKSSYQLPFTPYVPTFVDRFGSARVYTLPIGPKMAFVLSTEELDELSWRQAPNRYRLAVLRQARDRKSYIFGVRKEQIAGTLEKLT